MLRFHALWLSCATTLAQAPPNAPLGFGVETAFAENSQGASVRGFAYADDQGWYIAIGRQLVQRQANRVEIAHELAPGDDIAFCHRGPTGSVWFGSLRERAAFRLEPGTGALTRFVGVNNGFSVAPLPSGAILLSANPLWPQPGAQTGVWLAGPGMAPRELLTLSGPSGPLALDGAGNLIVAELGSVNPQPGTVRLLRIPAIRLQQVLTGGTLTTADADVIGSGWDGAYALAFDPTGQLAVTDNSNSVRLAEPTTLTPLPTPLLQTAPGNWALQMQCIERSSTPYLPYQPGEESPALLIATSNFVSSYEVLRLAPQRPQLTTTQLGPHPPGPIPLALTSAPPLGFCLLGATLAPAVPERVVFEIDETPIWLALADPGQLSITSLWADSQGASSLVLQHPGGFAANVTLQGLTIGQSGLGTTSHQTLQLLP
ncbi:MAG: hypothetical protein VYE77_08595 [Planctomycetota bacterium]|nr:hypothetical protein [Planctomycetota bacterium]